MSEVGMRTLRNILCIALMLPLGMTAQRFNDDYSDQFKKVRSLLNQGKYDKGKKLLEKLMSAEPNQAHIIATNGTLDLAYDDYSEAEKSFSKALGIDESNSIALMGMAQVYEHKQEYDLATASVDAAFFHNDELYYFEPIVAMKSKMLIRSGDYEQAEGLLQNAVDTEFDKIDLRLSLAIAQHLQGKEIEAIEGMKKLESAYSESQDDLNKIGETYNKLGKYEDAIKVLREANEMELGNVAVYTNVANSYYLNGEVNMAKGLIKTAIEDDESETPAAHHLKTRILIDEGKCREACKLSRSDDNIPMNANGLYPLVTYDLKTECGCNE